MVQFSYTHILSYYFRTVSFIVPILANWTVQRSIPRHWSCQSCLQHKAGLCHLLLSQTIPRHILGFSTAWVGFLPISCDTQGLREFSRGGSAALSVQVPSRAHSVDKFRHIFYTTLQSASDSLLLMLGGDFIFIMCFNLCYVLEEKKITMAYFSQICLGQIKVLEVGLHWASTGISYRY